MKKIKVNFRSLLLVVGAGVLFAVYWFWVNQKLISGTNHVFGLGTYFALMCAATAYFPLPANLIVLGAVKVYEPLVVALVGGLGTLVAYASEYAFFTFLFRLKKVANFKNSWIYKKAAPLFDRHRFFILTFVSFLPLPSEPIRIYAITTRYSKFLYPLAGFIGRSPRYFLLVYFGKEFADSVGFLVGVLLFPAVFLFAIKGATTLVEKMRQNAKSPKPALNEATAIIPSATGFHEPDLSKD